MGRQYVKALYTTFIDFCNKSSVTGFRYVVDSRRTWLERCIWFFIQLFLVVAVMLMIMHTVEDSVEDPMVISLETVGYPIENILFPGISICNINKISKKRAFDYARVISKKGNFPIDEVLDGVKILANLYDNKIIATVTVSDYLTFQNNLERYGVINGSDDNNYLYHIMKNLTTPCEELLYKCFWKGKQRNCSEIFELRRTYEGFCCTFNYIEYSAGYGEYKSSQSEPEVLTAAGMDMGLIVIARSELDDYFYPLIASEGLNVHIFDPLDYPDDTSGGLIQELIGIGTETLLDLNAKTLYSVPEIKMYPIATRKCIFPNEVPTPFGVYSLSNCLLACRVESILALCNCVPFLIPWYPNATPCSLPDIACLNKYQGKWQTLYPQEYESDELKHEKQNSLQCDNCYAECASTQYSVSTNWAPLNLQGPGKPKYDNFSVIRIYYGKAYTKLYRQDVIVYWFEILGNIGGVMGLFLGASLMSVIEFLYFFTIRFILILKRREI